MDIIHARLLKAFDYLKNKGIIHTQTQLAEKIGKTQQSVNAAFKDTPKRCTLGLMKAISDAFPEVLNRDYLLTGEGDVAAVDPDLRPHFFDDGAGWASVMRPRVPGFPDYDFSVEVAGDSPCPGTKKGDTLLCRRFGGDSPPPDDKTPIDTPDGPAIPVGLLRLL